MRSSKLGSLLALSILVLAAPARAAEKSDPPKDDPCKTTDGKKTVGCPQEPAKIAEKESMAFTNDDLERLFGESDAPTVPAKTPKPGSAQAAQAAALGAAASQDAKVPPTPAEAMAIAKAKLDEATQRLKDCEARTIQIANPLQPRPKLTPEEEKTWANMDNVARMKANDAAIEQAKRDIEQAKQDLAKAQAAGGQ